MSWLAQSIANSLQINEADHPTTSTDHNSNNQFQSIKQQEFEKSDSENETLISGGGVKEDLSEFTETLARQIWGVASFLAPPPPPPPPPPPLPASHRSPIDRHDDVENSIIEGLESRDEIEVSNSTTFLNNNKDDDDDDDDNDDDQAENVVGVTDEVLQFAMNIAHHPETWLDFPISEQDDEDTDDFEMSDTQWNHATLVERLVPRLAALRIEFCPIHMSESYFWKVYFVLLHSRLNKHDADLLSTPQIVAARTIWMKELQMKTKPRADYLERNTSHTLDSLDDYTTTSSNSPTANVFERTIHSFEPTTHFTVHDKQPVLTQENGSTEGVSDQKVGSSSYIVPVEELDEDEDNWIHENSELDGYDGPNVPVGDEEDISFSDLENDDCILPTRSKII
ncbi:uncharacterized protein [Rutidosis leptorrhynchoides]|uniref:uncharacterized protein n=1 Tax=Rutidosis leptorrhynchoides TaxID=125765 RepID=UPI003A99B810